ncbi:MAG: prolyl oligopeptidase family serine peptidase, partial [Cyclobacteriaceae bacterium]|nr:prolyl oligopeptidase family serine peptidase [Cyclobacteriaceae bacterium]
LRFSDNATMLFFGTTPYPVLQDTSRLSEEIINVEVWHYKDKRLYTQQNVELKKDRMKNYQAVFHILSSKMVQLANEEIPQIKTTFNWDATLVMGFSDLRYQREFSWEGWSKDDLYVIDVQTGNKKLIKEGVQGFSNLSSGGNYINWFDQTDSTYYVYHIATGKTNNLSAGIKTTLVDELHDSPILPYPYGFAGNTKNDEAILIYDRYDIWSLDPQNQKDPIRLTQGRESKTQYRYVHLDPEDPTIDISEMFIHSFNETSKKEGYAILSGKNKKLNLLTTDDFHFSSPIKARETQDIIFTKESFRVFPDLMASNFKFKKPVRISQANPEQSGYSWGSIELYNWISLDGEPLQGLLYKPQNFDPKKKYPLLTSFYERNSDNLHRHWGIVPHRSTINPTFYSSRGYVVFVPDIPYKMGYPGESCFNAVIPGVTSLIGEGYVDREKLGVQGHSWGGYQIAYLLTRTNMFTAAGSGAPVVNMISAYGGIRWGTGLSRMFQYEKTQSRIGGTLWEYPLRFMENSPIFFMDKVTTPVLILHNDNDAAVPWYQGIEMFTALRRLDKPAWMLNYNGEPHWPTKWENIRDYNIRLQQFFDYYLMGQPAPQWLEEGVPALMKGIDNGLELKK